MRAVSTLRLWCCTRTSARSRISPVAGDWVVELVGLEPTTKVLWNTVRVRPTPLVTPLQIAGRFAVLLDFPGFLILESTTRVLWNMVRVRPTTLVTPIQIVGRVF